MRVFKVGKEHPLFIDLSGYIFGLWTVLGSPEEVVAKHGRFIRKYSWLCKCKCGTERRVNAEKLKSKLTKSCGCLKIEHPEKFYNSLFIGYVRGARKRNIEITITKEEFKEFCSKNCYYCGRLPSNERRVKPDGKVLLYNGIDRIDNTKGYILENCITCCFRCNRAKDTYTAEEFLEHCRQVVKFLENKNISLIT